MGRPLDAWPPKQTTRMLKYVCPRDRYSVRTTRKWIRLGVPRCPFGHKMEAA